MSSSRSPAKKSSVLNPEKLAAFEEIAKRLMSTQTPAADKPPAEKPAASGKVTASGKLRRSKSSPPKPAKAVVREASLEAGPSRLPNLNLSSDEGEFLDDDPVESVGFVSNFTDKEDEPSEERLGISASAFQGRWFTDKQGCTVGRHKGRLRLQLAKFFRLRLQLVIFFRLRLRLRLHPKIPDSGRLRLRLRLLA